MVSVIVVSRFTEDFPGADAPVRKIEGGPLYPSTEVMTLLTDSAGQCVIPWTTKCIADIQKLELDNDDLIGLLHEVLVKGKYIDSEWCEQRVDGPWAACDAYSLTRREWMPAANREMDMEYFVKYAIGKTGAILLLVSCHSSI